MVRLPASLFGSLATIEPYAGTTGQGQQTFGSATAVSCLHAPGVRLVRDQNGNEVVSSATLYCPANTTPPPAGSRVTIDGAAHVVILSRAWTAPGLPLPESVEISLQ